MTSRGRFWALWTICLLLLGLLLAVPYLTPGSDDPWYPARTAVVGFMLIILSLVAAVSTFAARERLREVCAATADTPPSAGDPKLRAMLSIWLRCLLIGFFGSTLAYFAASPAAAWPYIAGAAVLLVLHAPRHRLFGHAAGPAR